MIRKAISQLIALIVGCYTFLGVCVVCVVLTEIPAALAPVFTGGFTYDSLKRWDVSILFLLACVVAFYTSYPMARFINRLFPIKANGTRRRGLILACLLFLLLFLGILAFPYPDFLRIYFVGVVPLAVLVLVTLGLTILWQVRTTRTLNKPFVLFLRRFSSFSDRSILGALLASRPAGYRMAFLAPLMDTPANFSPMVVAFSGTNLRRPLSSCPIAIQAMNAEWEDRVEDLARAAACVVIDSSYRSPAIEREIEIVVSAKEPDKVLWLLDESSDEKGRLPISSEGGTMQHRVIRYRRSWKAALPRIVMELFVLGIVVLGIGASLAGDPQIASLLQPWIFPGVGFAFLLLSSPIIFQPSMDRKARSEMKHTLAQVLSRDAMIVSGLMPIFPNTGKVNCSIICSQDDSGQRNSSFLARAAGLANMQTVVLHAGGNPPRALRDAIRSLGESGLVVVDVTSPDSDVQYLLGIAHGLGRKVVLVSTQKTDVMRGSTVVKFASDSEASLLELATTFLEVHGNPDRKGPVAALLTDMMVFGEPLAGRRMMAFFVDLILCSGLLLSFVLWRHGQLVLRNEPWIELIWIFALIFISYRFLLLAFTGTTVGMWTTALRLVNIEGGAPKLSQALGRSAAFFLEFFPFLHYLIGLYGPRYQVLEDMLSNTRVIRRERKETN
jgi:uncharacterized RDD family membrane protein YckC